MSNFDQRPEFYFPRDVEWRDWLSVNYNAYPKGINLVFYKLETKIETMRWAEAVRVALCYGWIDSTVKSLGGGKRVQYFCPRNPKSNWSALNKKYILEMEPQGLIHKAGYAMIELAKKSGTWTFMDDVENLIMPKDLKAAFIINPQALENYNTFSPGYRKSYLSWLKQAKREETRNKRIHEIVRLCALNIKSR